MTNLRQRTFDSPSCAPYLRAGMKLCCPWILVLFCWCGASAEPADSGKHSLVGVASERLLAYPRRIVIPDSIPAVDVDHQRITGTDIPILPTVDYAIYHYEGWQECLYLFAGEGVDVQHREFAGVAFAHSGNIGKYLTMGLRDGFSACRERIAELREKHSLERLRGMAKNSYNPLFNSRIRPRRNADENYFSDLKKLSQGARPIDLERDASSVITRTVRETP